MSSRVKTLVIVGSVAALIVAAGFSRELYNNYQVDREIEKLRDKAKALETERFSISELKDTLGSQDFLEGEARLKMGLKKPGETAIIIPEVTTEPIVVETSAKKEEPKENGGNTVKEWFKRFFSK
ncbi:MAG: septum formation initiator family protein [bacterium]